MNTTQNLLRFIVGDWSHDGHNQHDEVLLNCNKTVPEIRNAYLASIGKTGIDLSEIASEYQDNSIPMQIAQKLQAHGLDLKTVLDAHCHDTNEPEEWHMFMAEDFTKLFMAFVGLSLPDLSWSFAKIPAINALSKDGLSESFGYGLYD